MIQEKNTAPKKFEKNIPKHISRGRPRKSNEWKGVIRKAKA